MALVVVGALIQECRLKDGSVERIVRQVALGVDVEKVDHGGLRSLLRLNLALAFVHLTEPARQVLEVTCELVGNLTVSTQSFSFAAAAVQGERNRVGGTVLTRVVFPFASDRRGL